MNEKEKRVIIMQLSNKELELLSTYQNWLKENKLNDKCNAYFISQTSMLVFQIWELEKLISETVWLKNESQDWQYYIKTLGEKFNKSFFTKWNFINWKRFCH